MKSKRRVIFNDGDPTYNPFNEFLKNYGIYFAIAIAGIVLLTVLVLFLLSLKKRKQIAPKEETPAVDSSKALDALGGRDNIVSHSLNGSRIALELKDYSLVDEKALNEAGVASVIKMSNKITLVIKGDSNKFYNSLF